MATINDKLNETMKLPETHDPIFYRSYSRTKDDNTKESWEEVTERCVQGLIRLGQLTEYEQGLIRDYQLAYKSLVSGRWLWIGGTPWGDLPENSFGGYNCSGDIVTSLDDFEMLADLEMQGCGIGTVLEKKFLDKLPKVRYSVDAMIENQHGSLYEDGG